MNKTQVYLLISLSFFFFSCDEENASSKKNNVEVPEWTVWDLSKYNWDNSYVLNIQKTNDGKIWFSYDNYMLYIENEEVNLHVGGDTTFYEWITDFHVENKDSILVRLDGGRGIYSFNGYNWHMFEENSKIEYKGIEKFQDSYWIATFSAWNPYGIFLYKNNKLEKTELGGFAYSLKNFNDEELILGFNGSVAIVEDGIIEVFNIPGNYEIGPITALERMSSGDLWVGDYLSKIIKYSNGTWELIGIPQGFLIYESDVPQYNEIVGIESDNHGNVWIATERSGLIKYDGENWIHLTPENSNLPSEKMGFLFFDDLTGLLWIGGEDFIARHNPN